MSELMDEIQSTIVDCQVSSEAQIGWAIWIVDVHSLLRLYPAPLVNYLPRRRGPVLDVTN